MLLYSWRMLRKKHLFIFLIFVCLQSVGQKKFTTGILNIQAESLSQDISDYCFSLGHDKLERSNILDSFASVRARYFLSLLKETSRNKSLKILVGFIPDNREAHRRFFSNPDVFNEPENVSYPESLPYIPQLGSKVKAEIMQQDVYSLLSAKNLTGPEIIKKAIKSFTDESGEDFILLNYKKSSSHHSAIKKYSKNKMGVSVEYLVSKEWKKSENKWNYEVLIYSLAVFTE